MKISVILGLMACKAVLAAVALDESSSLPRGELGWSGSVTPGGPEVEYWGEDLDVSHKPTLLWYARPSRLEKRY